MTDQQIINTFYCKKGCKLHPYKWKKCVNKEEYFDEYNYILNRYDDSESLYESLYRIRHNIEIRPVCHYCGGHIEFDRKYYNPFRYTCSKECAGKLIAINGKKTCLEKYGVDSAFKTEKAKENYKKTCLEKYGVEYAAQTEKVKQHMRETCFKKYGVEYAAQAEEVKEKIKKSYIKNFGVDSPMKNEKIKKKKDNTCITLYGVPNTAKLKEFQNKRKKTCLEKYGVECASQAEEVKEKMKNTFLNKYGYITCAVHFKSNSENKIYELIKEKYPNVIRQYVDKVRYPFHCDFYIPSLDMFIEYQGYTFTHYTHPYNKDSMEDQMRVKKFKIKALTNDTYKCALDIWTVRDPLKRQTAKDNNLNYVELWSVEEAEAWVKTL